MVPLWLAMWLAAGSSLPDVAAAAARVAAAAQAARAACPPIDWTAYYARAGYSGPGQPNGRVTFVPVLVSPTMQWATPSDINPPAPGQGPSSRPPLTAP